MFNAWCQEAGVSALPASVDTVSLYCTWMMTENGNKASTASRHACAIAWYHRQATMPSPVTFDVKEVLTSVRRGRREKPQGKAALTGADLVRISESLDAATNAGARDRAILILGFATCLRRSDLAVLELADVTFAPEGLVIVVRYGKTDQFGRGRVLSVWPGARPATDPVLAAKNWIARRGAWPGPLFCRIEKSDVVKHIPISGEAVHDAVVRMIRRAGMDPKPYGAHSLRAGAITAAAIAGGSDIEIMRLSGHANAAVMRRYVRIARVFQGRNPLAGVL